MTEESGSDQYYFDSYANFDIHEVMLKDKVRTLSYRNAIYHNPKLFKSKTILDVGCGTGILSLFSAKTGAAKVYAVDKSGIADYAKKIVEKNGYSDVIQVLHGGIEDLDIPDKVDVIVSEWMGYCLLYESMLPSVISARDRFMNPEGTMFPNRAKMFITGFEDANFVKRKFGFWDNVCGVKLPATKKCVLMEPVVDTAPEQGIVTDDSILADFDLNKVTTEELTFEASWSLTPLESTELNGFIVWFDVSFEGPEATVILSTSPFEPSTHWAQTIFYLEEPIHVDVDVPIKGTFAIQPNDKNHRDQDVMLTYEHNGKTHQRSYKMR